MGKGQWAIAVQGGAGDIPIELPKHIKDGRESALRHCLDIGSSALNQSHSSLHVVELVLDNVNPIQNKAKVETHNPDGDSQLGTVGCVAVDLDGHLAAATSTGGVINKWVGRIGDTPIIGSGTYANTYCAVSTTGSGEDIIRGTVARDVAALMEYKGLSLKEATSYVVKIGAPECKFGLVAVSATGEIAMPFGTTGMFRACATQDGYSEIAIH